MSRPKPTKHAGGVGVDGKTGGAESSEGGAEGAGGAQGAGEGGALDGDPGVGKKDGSQQGGQEGGGVDPSAELRTLRRRAKTYQGMAAKSESKVGSISTHWMIDGNEVFRMGEVEVPRACLYHPLLSTCFVFPALHYIQACVHSGGCCFRVSLRDAETG